MTSGFPLLAAALEQGLEADSAGGDVQAVLGMLGLPDATYHSFEPLADRTDAKWLTPSAALIGATSAPFPVSESPREPTATVMPKPEPSLSVAQPATTAPLSLSFGVPMHDARSAPAGRSPVIPAPPVPEPARQMQTGIVRLSDVFRILSGRSIPAEAATPRSLRDVFSTNRQGF